MNLEKSKLEKEKEKLLVTNVDMAEETKNLILEKKQWENLKQVRYFFYIFCILLSLSIDIYPYFDVSPCIEVSLILRKFCKLMKN